MATLEYVPDDNFRGKYRCYWNYFNSDAGGLHPNTCCGQAAIYSALRTMDGKQTQTLKGFVNLYPPNLLGGSLGSSWQRIIEILKSRGYKTEVQYGESALRKALPAGPVLVCLDIGASGWDRGGLHWVTVFGYTESTYYITAWEKTGYWITRKNFLAGWKTWLTITASATSNACFIPYK